MTWVRRSRSSFAKILTATSLTALIYGCGANHYAIYRNERLTDERDGARGIFLDASQRAIFTSPVAHPSANMPSRSIVCAEPSPDAIVAISQQFAAAAQASYLNFSGSGQLQGSEAAAVTALGQRTASIQLLRDAYYRLCEARMDGFITNGTYPVALNRLDDAMVALLAIEHLTSPNAITAVPSITSPIVTPTQFSTAGNENNPVNPPAPAPAPAPGAPAPAPVNRAPTPKQTRRAVDGRTLSQAKNDGIVLVSTTDRSAGVLLAKSGDSAAAPDATASTSGSAPPPATVVDQKASSGTGTGGTSNTDGTGGAGNTGGTPPPASKVTSDVGVGVNAATVEAVNNITSIYQFKNLDETCLQLAGQTLQVEFQLFAKAKTDSEFKRVEGVAHYLEGESNVHVWRYCNQIFDEFFLARTRILQAPVSATGSLVNPPTGLKLTPDAKPSQRDHGRQRQERNSRLSE